MLPLAEPLDQPARVDAEGTRDLAGPVGGAGLDPVVLVLLEEGPLDRRSGRLAGHLPVDDDPLARGRRQMAARADGLAESALDTGRRHLLDLRRRLQVAQMHAGI